MMAYGERVQNDRGRRMRAMNGAGLCRIGMAIVVLTAVAHAQVAPKKEENRAPIVTDGMTTGEFGQILKKARAMEKAKSCGQRIRERGKPFSLEELAGAKVKRIRVVRAETYKIWPAPKPEQAREMIEKVGRENLDGWRVRSSGMRERFGRWRRSWNSRTGRRAH